MDENCSEFSTNDHISILYNLYSNDLVIFIIVASSYNLRSLLIFEKNRNVVISRKFGTIFIHEPIGAFFWKIISSSMLRQVGNCTFVDN